MTYESKRISGSPLVSSESESQKTAGRKTRRVNKEGSAAGGSGRPKGVGRGRGRGIRNTNNCEPGSVGVEGDNKENVVPVNNKFKKKMVPAHLPGTSKCNNNC
jgi:hypothetical protein